MKDVNIKSCMSNVEAMELRIRWLNMATPLFVLPYGWALVLMTYVISVKTSVTP